MPYAAARLPSSSTGAAAAGSRASTPPSRCSRGRRSPDLPELREVQRLVERAGVRRAVAEERDGDALLAAHLERERSADDAGHAAADDGVRAEVADLDVVQVHRAAVAAAAAFDLAVELGHDPLDRRPLRDRVPVGAVRRRDDVLARERGADARRRCLLADRDVQEPGQLAGAEAILDLLLEPADEQHLAEEAAQDLLRDARPSGPGPLFDGRHRAAIMLIRRCGPPTSGTRSRRASTPTGPKSSSRSPPKDRSGRRRGARPAAARTRRERASAPRHARRGRRRARAEPLRRLDRRRIWGTLVAHRGHPRRAPAPRRRLPSSRPRSLAALGRGAVGRSRRTGATSSASSSSTRATTCRAPRCSARR